MRTFKTLPKGAYELPVSERSTQYADSEEVSGGFLPLRPLIEEVVRATSRVHIGTPLMLTRNEAAELCRVSPSAFDDWVRRGIVPGPKIGTRRWSRAKLQRALDDDVEAVAAPESTFQQWRRENADRGERH